MNPPIARRLTTLTTLAALLSTAALPAAIAALALAVPAHAAAARQVTKAAEPYVVVITAEAGVPLRAGDSTLFYPIATAKPGDMLLVDAETAGWLRVAYPQGLEVFVKADDAAEPDASNTTRLTRPSRLLAPNLNAGARASFMQALEADLPSGTTMKVARVVRSDTNGITHYAVPAPTGARAFVSREAVRRATADEAARFMNAGVNLGTATTAAASAPTSTPATAPTPAPVAAVTTAPVSTPTPTPAPAPTPTPMLRTEPILAAAPAAANAATSPPAPTSNTSTTKTVTTTTTTQQLPVSSPNAIGVSARTDSTSALGVIGSASQQATEIPMTIPVKAQGQAQVQAPAQNLSDVTETAPTADQEPPAAPTLKLTTIKTTVTTSTAPTLTFTQSIDQLAATFNRVSRQPLMTAEIEPAIAQFEAFKTTLGGTERDQRIAASLQGYLDALRLRMDLRESMRTAQANAASGQLIGTPLGQRVAELERQRVYNIIGRLVRSTVYDGNRVPLLYRVMSPEPGSARTLGYILPGEKFDLANKLEQVVGIIGEIRPDPSLRTNLITPRRVDVVSLEPIVISPDIPGVVLTPAQRQALPPRTRPSQTTPEAKPEARPEARPAVPGEELPKLNFPAPSEPNAPGEPSKDPK